MTILIAGGGTGGHVYPMLAVGDAVRSLDAAARVFYVGTARGLEARVMSERGEDLELLPVDPLRGGGAIGFVKGAFRAATSLLPAFRLIRRRRPDAVLSVGGYAAGPVSLAARLMGVPVTLLEPNSVLGLSNRLLAPLAERAYTAFGDLSDVLGPDRTRNFGVPLRSTFAASPYRATSGRFRVLVLGGSLGAKHLNEVVPFAFAELVKHIPQATILHQTGRNRGDETKARYASASVTNVEVTEFVSDVASELERADVVLQRAGASSLAELCAVGRASVLVPFPFAADDHQLKNARALEAGGAAIAIPQQDASAIALGRALVSLAERPELRESMATRALSFGRPTAAEDVARDLLEIALRGRSADVSRSS